MEINQTWKHLINRTLNIVTWQLKAGLVEWIDVAIARQWCGKHISTATDTEATIRGYSVSYAINAEIM
jgi:hypothetical protein